jgi:two-component system, sensor histidine kinase and response regulator
MNTPATSAANPAQPPCLLLVDDTPANIDILVGLLQDDYRLKVATRGEKALQLCQEDDAIDLVLLDVMMPGMDGFAVCRHLRAAPATQELPVIFLTAKTEVESVVEGFAIGANDYVTKPFQPAELRARVKTHLTLRAQRREIVAKNTELRELLQLVCHDVNNQFSVIAMSLELLAMDPSRSWQTMLPRFETAARNGIGLTRLVRELREAEEKGLVLHPVALREAVEECVLIHGDLAQAKGVTLDCEVAAITVQAERVSLINSVLGNLLSNAIKFSYRGGRIMISTLPGAPGWVKLRIADQGMGMTEQVRSTLFDVSKSRSLPGTEGERGTGFGMPLLRRFVHDYGGSIELHSRPVDTYPHDHGTDFILHLRQAGDPA